MALMKKPIWKAFKRPIFTSPNWWLESLKRGKKANEADLGLGKAVFEAKNRLKITDNKKLLTELQNEAKKIKNPDLLITKNHTLNLEEWSKIEIAAKKTISEFELRRSLLLTRLNASISSFLWSERGQKKFRCHWPTFGLSNRRFKVSKWRLFAETFIINIFRFGGEEN